MGWQGSGLQHKQLMKKVVDEKLINEKKIIRNFNQNLAGILAMKPAGDV